MELNNPQHQIVVDRLSQQFPKTFLDAQEHYGMLVVLVEKSDIKAIVKFLSQNEEMGFAFLTDICGMHYDKTNELGVVYHLHNFYSNLRIRIKTVLPIDKPEIDSLTDLFDAANWQERETFDFFGIIFKGHPNLKRILNMDEMDYFPLRKEYALEDGTRTDKNDTMFGR